MTRAINRARNQPGESGRTPVRFWIVVRRRAERRSDTDLAATKPRRAVPAAAVAADCGRQLVRWRDRARRPPVGARQRDRECTCTRELRPGFAGPRGPSARTRCAPGFARSSRQAVPALGATCPQHGSPGAGAHPVTEAVLLGAATIVRLVGALHATLLGHAPTVGSTSMANENLERRAATSRLDPAKRQG